MATPEEIRRAIEEAEETTTARIEEALQGRDNETVLDDVEEVVGSFGVGANRGLANILGLPVDAVNFLLRQAGVPVSDAPFGGSESIRRGLESIGVLTDLEQAERETGRAPGDLTGELANRLAARVGEEIGAGTVPAGATLRFARGVGTAGGIFGPIIQSARSSPLGFLGLETLAATGGGIGAGVAREVAPGNLLAEVGGQIVGGLGIAPVGTAARATGRAIGGIVRPFTSGGRRRIAAEIVQDAATRPPEENIARLETDVPDLPGAQFTSAQITNDPGLLALERGVVRKNAELAGEFQEITSATNQAARQEILEATGGRTDSQAIADFLKGRVDRLVSLIDQRTATAVANARSQIDNIQPTASSEDAARIVRQELEQGLLDARTTETALWQSIYSGRNVGTAPVKDQIDRIRALARKADDPANIPEDIGRVIDNFDGTETVDEILALRSRILAARRAENAKDAPNRALLKNLDQLQEASLRALGLLENQATEQGAQQIRSALDFSRHLNDTYTRGPVGKVLGFDARGGERVADLETLDRLLRPGRAGGTSADAIVAALTSQIGGGDIEGGRRIVEGVQNFIFNEFLSATHGSAGRFDANAGRRFLERHASALDRFPGIKSQIEEAVQSGNLAQIFERSGARLQRTLTDVRRSRAAVFLDRDVDRAIAATFSSRKPGLAMQELVRQARRDPTGEALEGLKQGVFQHMMRQVQLGAMDLVGEPMLSARLFRNFRNDNAKTLAAIYSPEELRRLAQVGKALDTAERSIRSAVAGGSDTAQNRNVLADATLRIMGGTAGARVGAATGGSPLVTANVLATKVRQFFFELPEKMVREMVERAVFDPDLMKTLLAVPTPANSERVFRQLNGHLLNLQLPPITSEEAAE